MSVIGVLSRDVVPGESTPALAGIAEEAHRTGSGLVLCADLGFAGVERLGMSGCVLLDRVVDDHDLAFLADHAIPFVSIGRRERPGGLVPYVDIDYAAGVRGLVARTAALGHRNIVYIGLPFGAASVERRRGFHTAVTTLGLHGVHVPAAWLDQLLRTGVTAVITEHPDDAVALIGAARRRGLSVPEHLSVLTLDMPEHDGLEITGMRVPRWETGCRAVQLLSSPPWDVPQELFACEFVAGTTLARPSGQS
ncbi:LacI family DNA-binding transcriptional regulator [Lentzea sp.]|uniref:LacI family DNA-binding transcriptional regulator n=1 Tax=Lentzea sp. TaxID=56099 RepID=UPI002CDB723A|nr:LacI family DNA-binding transcriptional regulator [Lentzea sp.]HUQ59129.1 LacI family DNA-binding transcriptional regulator [Lentzea sp.]